MKKDMCCVVISMTYKKLFFSLLSVITILIFFSTILTTTKPDSYNQLFLETRNNDLSEIEAIKNNNIFDFQISLEELLESLNWVDKSVVTQSVKSNISSYRISLFGDNVCSKFDEDAFLSCLSKYLEDITIINTYCYEDEILIDIDGVIIEEN